MPKIFGSKGRKELEEEIQGLEEQIRAKDRKIKKLENQIWARTGVESLDPDGVLAILKYRELSFIGERHLSALEYILGCNIGDAEIVKDESSGYIIIRPQPTDAAISYEVLLPLTNRYGNLSQIASILSPMRFEPLRPLLDVEEEEQFFVLSGRIDCYDEDEHETRQLTILPPESENLIVIRQGSTEEQGIDITSCQQRAETRTEAALTQGQLSELTVFRNSVLTEYRATWYEGLEGVIFTSED